MADHKTHRGNTPAGGVRAEAFYLDKHGEMVDETVAVQIRILEYDKSGKMLRSTLMYRNGYDPMEEEDVRV